MKKLDMLNYLDQELDKKLSDYEVGLYWDTKNHTIEIIIRLYAENSESLSIDDVDGVFSEEEIIEFEDGILLYNTEKSVVDQNNYLAVIPFEGKKGCKKSVLDGLLDYLKDILDVGQSDLLDFLESESEEAVFELQWNEGTFEHKVTNNSESTRKDEYIPYPNY